MPFARSNVDSKQSMNFRIKVIFFGGILFPSQGFLQPQCLRPISVFKGKSEILAGNELTPPTPEWDPEESTSPEAKSLPYNWKEQWYALTFASYVQNPSQSAEAVPASVFGHPLVLWKSEDDGPISCADDICPHRSAALSEGRVRDGNLECLYHGWQYKGADKDNPGDCAFIPQLEKGANIPKSACLRMREARVVEGIVWAWMGDGPPTRDPPRQDDGLDEMTGKKEGFIVNDFQIDLPYDHSFLVENLIDPAHIPISHDRTPGGGKRENAEAYEMIVDETSVTSTGFTGRYRTESSSKKDGPWIEVKFEAPGIIRQSGNPRGNIQFGAALHCMPLGLGHSRLLFRAYFGGLPALLQLVMSMKPKFLRDLNSCKILEQDVGLITTQEDHFARNKGRTLSDDFILLRSSDRFVGEYRKWMDRVGHGMPWFQGLASRSANVGSHLPTGQGILQPALDLTGHRASNQIQTRYHRHVMHCPTTRNALHKVRLLKKFFIGLSILAITATSGVTSYSMVATDIASQNTGLTIPLVTRRILRFLLASVPISSIAAALLHRLEKEFYVSFKRRDQLRTEKGIA